MPSTLRQLNKLAQLYGVQTAYRDVLGARHHASRESLQGVLAAMGVPLDSAGGADERPNWQRKMRYGLEQLCETQQFRETLKMVDRFRAGRLAAERNGDVS